MSNSWVVPPAGVAPQIPAWKLKGWSEQQEHAMWRSWAQNFARSGHNEAANYYFDKCIDGANINDFMARSLRSNFYRSIAKVDQALEDSKRAASIAPANAYVNLQVADALYDLNRFEENKVSLYINTTLYTGTKLQPYNRRLQIVNANFHNNVGDSLRPFFLNNMSKMREIFDATMKVDSQMEPAPRWKVLKDLNKCEVRSIQEKNVVRISPLEMARRKRKTKIYHQNYLNGSWIDVAFLKALRKSPIVLLDKHYKSAKERRQYLDNSYATVKMFSKMLHSRSPMFSEQYQLPKTMESLHQSNMYRIQYQTRRNMLSILRTIRAIREQKDVQVSRTNGQTVPILPECLCCRCQVWNMHQLAWL